MLRADKARVFFLSFRLRIWLIKVSVLSLQRLDLILFQVLLTFVVRARLELKFHVLGRPHMLLFMWLWRIYKLLIVSQHLYYYNLIKKLQNEARIKGQGEKAGARSAAKGDGDREGVL